MFKEVLTAVQTALTDIPEIRYVAEDWGQLDYYGNRPPVKFPCILIDAKEADYRELSRGAQQAEGLISVRFAHFDPVNKSAAAPDKNKPFEVFDLLDKIFIALQGLSGPTFSRLNRMSMRKVDRDDAIREFVLVFRFGATITMAVPQPKPVRPQPVIDIK